MRQNVMKPWPNFMRRKQPKKWREKETRGKDRKSSPTKASQNVASQIPSHTHKHTNIENTEIMISDTSETCRWGHKNNNNNCLKSILHFVQLV
jgi:hypothetical protein